MIKAEKLAGLAPYVFSILDEKIQKYREAGRTDIINFGKADPDHPTPDSVVKRLQETAADPENHHYTAFRGSLALRKRIAQYYQERFGVKVNPETEILALLGSKEGLFHISLAYLKPGDIGLVPDPSFPAYNDGVFFAGGDVLRMPLLEQNHFLPDLESLTEEQRQRAKILFLNYPNNPTGAFAPPEYMKKAIQFCQKHEILLCYDHAYAETYFEGKKPKSLLEYEGGKEAGVEFFTFSKSFNMTGWRLGAAIGSEEVINSLLIVQSHINSGIFAPIQFAGMEALEHVTHTKFLEEQRAEYQRRRDYALKKLNEIGWKVHKPDATVYLWLPVPKGYSSMDFANLLLDEYSVVVAPGTAFGDTGEGYVRISLTTEYANVEKGIDRICEAILKVAGVGAKS